MFNSGDVSLVTLHARILSELARHPTVSQERLALNLEVTRRTIQRHLAELEEYGYLHADRSQRPFTYALDWSRPWPDVPWLSVIAFHPAVAAAYSRLTDRLIRWCDAAAEAGTDPSEELADILAPTGVPAGR